MTYPTNETLDSIQLNIRKRPWYVWLGRGVWVLWLAAWLEIAVGSYLETEFFAFRTSLKVFVVSLLLGVLLYVWRLRHHRRSVGSRTHLS
ncbi:MAG: hypothetical protein GY906_32455 [bacterium]|nr:hypothetical protein [bacterium]